MKKYIKEIRPNIIISIILFGIETLLVSAMLLFPGYLIDTYKQGKERIFQLILIYSAIFLIYLLTAYISNRLGDMRRVRFERSIKRDFFTSVMNQSKAEFKKYELGEYVSIQGNDIAELCQNFLGPFVSVFRSLLMIVIFGGALFFYTTPLITAVIIGASIFALFVPKLTAKKLAFKNHVYFETIGKYTARISTLFKAHPIQDKKVEEKIVAVHEKELSDVMSKQQQFRKLNSKALVLNGGSVEVIGVLTFCVIAFVLVNYGMTVGMAVVAFTYSTRFIEPIHELNLNVSRIRSIDKIKNRLLLFVGKEQQAQLPEVVCDVISFDHVQKVFPTHTLTFSNMVFKRDQTHLIIGDNGVGKSVILQLLLGEHDVSCGVIKVNDTYPIQTVSLDSQFVYVPQKSVIIDSGYIDNITMYGAYSESNLLQYESYFPPYIIEKLKQRTDFQNLSGGEKQVIALLRALCSEKPFLILDEPFSAMNAQLVEYFMQYLSEMNKTVIMVAHQLEQYEVMFDYVYKVG